jgi:hypothetical protein
MPLHAMDGPDFASGEQGIGETGAGPAECDARFETALHAGEAVGDLRDRRIHKKVRPGAGARQDPAKAAAEQRLVGDRRGGDGVVLPARLT